MNNIDKQIGEGIAKTGGLSVKKLGLRFDKVVIQLLGYLRASVESAVLKGEAVIVTITAPIKLPAKTAYELEGQIKDILGSGIRQGDHRVTIFQNQVHIRIVSSSPTKECKFIGLVHNPGTDANLLLELATQWLVKD